MERELLGVFVRDYLTFHAAQRSNLTARVLVFRPARTGLGDTFGQLMLAYWTAVVSERVFLFDWQRPFPVEHVFETADNRTNLFLQRKTDMDVDTLRADLAILDSSLNSRAQFAKIVASTTQVVVMSMAVAPTLAVLKDLVRNSQHAEIRAMHPGNALSFTSNANCQRALMHHALQLNAALRHNQRTQARALGLYAPIAHSMTSGFPLLQFASWQQRWRGESGRPYVAVHARLGTGVGETAGRFERIARNLIVPARCLAARAVHLSLLIGSPPLPIYLATDTPAFRTEFANAVREASHARVAVKHGNWSIVHSSKLQFFTSSRNLSRYFDSAEWHAIWAGYMDLIMLGHAKHIIALHSTFPKFAFALGTAESLTELHNDICFTEQKWS